MPVEHATMTGVHASPPMAPEHFWQLVALLDGDVGDDAVTRLTEALRKSGPQEAAAFQEQLALVLHDFDREQLFRQPVRWVDDPPGALAIPLSSDSFLSLRAHVVAGGQAAVERVLNDPTSLLERLWDDGESLLYAASWATGEVIETQVSYETGANQVHWSEAREISGARTDAGGQDEPNIADSHELLARDYAGPLLYLAEDLPVELVASVLQAIGVVADEHELDAEMVHAEGRMRCDVRPRGGRRPGVRGGGSG